MHTIAVCTLIVFRLDTRNWIVVCSILHCLFACQDPPGAEDKRKRLHTPLQTNSDFTRRANQVYEMATADIFYRHKKSPYNIAGQLTDVPRSECFHCLFAVAKIWNLSETTKGLPKNICKTSNFNILH